MTTIPNEVIQFVMSCADSTHEEFGGGGHTALQGNINLEASVSLLLEESTQEAINRLQAYTSQGLSGVVSILGLQEQRTNDARAGLVVRSADQQARDVISKILLDLQLQIESLVFKR
jgi:hypothetical protein